MDKPKKTPPILKRDANNNLIDPKEGHKIAGELTKKLLFEQRLHEKQESFHISRTKRRDVAVHISLTITNRVNNKIVIGEQEREYNQWCVVVPARMLPASKSNMQRALWELTRAVEQAMLQLGQVTL